MFESASLSPSKGRFMNPQRSRMGAAVLVSVAFVALAVFGVRALSTDVGAISDLPGGVVPRMAEKAVGQHSGTKAAAPAAAPVVDLKTWEDTGKPSGIHP